MNLMEFLESLNTFYPIKNDEQIIPMIAMYEDVLENEIRKTGRRYDFDKVLYQIVKTYPKTTYPSMPVILSALPFGVLPPEVSYSGEEGKVIKKCINGVDYEFVIVPNHWQGVKTTDDLNRL